MQYAGALQLEKNKHACISQPGGCMFGCISGLGVFPVYFSRVFLGGVFYTRYFFYFLRSAVGRDIFLDVSTVLLTSNDEAVALLACTISMVGSIPIICS
jgi:hypothetical protein